MISRLSDSLVCQLDLDGLAGAKLTLFLIGNVIPMHLRLSAPQATPNNGVLASDGPWLNLINERQRDLHRYKRRSKPYPLIQVGGPSTVQTHPLYLRLKLFVG
jgi:hypothetical protein